MKNYYDTQRELEVAEIRLNVLQNKKNILFEKMMPKSSQIKEVVTNGGKQEDAYAKYIAEVYELDKELELKKNEVNMLKYNLKKMEIAMREMKELEEKVFVMRYIDNKKVKHIARELNYTEKNIYRVLDIIKEKIEKNRKIS